MNHEQDNWDDEDEGPSKSARKREMEALQALGTRLTQLTEPQLKQIPFPSEQLQDAVMLARKIKARGGLRRQLQFIGKLMRTIDSEPIEEALARLDGTDQASKARFHQLEILRDQLLTDGDRALPQAIARYPEANRQQIRQLLRQHEAEQSAGKAPAAARKLFRYLRDLDEASDSDEGTTGGDSSDSIG